MAYSATASATVTHNRAKYKPHDKLPIRVAKAAINFAAGVCGADQTVNVITIPAGSVILAVNLDVTTIEGGAVPIDIGFGEAGEQFLSNGVCNTAAQTVCLGVPYLIQSATKITATPDATALSTAVIDIYACYIEFDSLTAAN